MIEEIVGKYSIYLVILFITLFLRGAIMEFISGLIFYFEPLYKENDIILFNDKKSRIVKIGFMSTTFYNLNKKTVFKINNSRIKYYIMEKVIRED